MNQNEIIISFVKKLEAFPNRPDVVDQMDIKILVSCILMKYKMSMFSGALYYEILEKVFFVIPRYKSTHSILKKYFYLGKITNAIRRIMFPLCH